MVLPMQRCRPSLPAAYYVQALAARRPQLVRVAAAHGVVPLVSDLTSLSSPP